MEEKNYEPQLLGKINRENLNLERIITLILQCSPSTQRSNKDQNLNERTFEKTKTSLKSKVQHWH